MANKKIVVLFILTLFLLPSVLNFITSDLLATDAANSSIFGITPDSGVRLTSQWEYLGKEWKNILMKNSVVKGIDSFFQKISFAFSFLFGMDYSLSVALFLTVALWLFVFFMLTNVLGNTIFSKWVSVLISFCFSILLAQIKLFQIPVNLLIGLFFGEKTWWMKLIIGIVVVAVLVIIFILVTKFGKQFAEMKKKTKEEEDRIKLHTGAKVGEELVKAVSKGK